MLPLKAIIVDDEELGRKNLAHLLETHCRPEIELCAMAGSAAEAKQLIYEHDPEVVFLDIQMPEVSGLELLAALPVITFSTVIVSAHKEHGIAALKAGAIDYLLKPISIQELQGTVKKLWTARRLHGERQATHQSMGIPHASGTSIVDLQDIVYLKAENNYTEIVIQDQKALMAAKTIKKFEQALNNREFFRIHKSAIINLNHVRTYTLVDGGKVNMKDGTTLLISRRRLPEFLERIKDFTIELE